MPGKDMTATILIQVNSNLYLRDPQDTELGRKIIQHSIVMLYKLGFEDFTFKKLAEQIQSTEASVYRYFESKHKLLLYLVAWYWSWILYRIDRHTINIDDPERELKIILRVLSQSGSDDPASPYVDEEILHRLVISESTKAFLTNQAKEQRQQAVFEGRTQLAKKIASVIKSYNADYEYPLALASSIIVLAHRQTFYAKFFPELTEVRVKKGNSHQVVEFLESVMFSVL